MVFIELPVTNKARYICQITEKYFMAGKRILIYVKNESEARTLDRALWTWKEDSFIPHVFAGNPDLFPDDPVLLTDQPVYDPSFFVIILYDPLPPDQFEKYDNVIDFAETYDAVKLQESRSRYKKIKEASDLNLSFIKLGSFLHQKME